MGLSASSASFGPRRRSAPRTSGLNAASTRTTAASRTTVISAGSSRDGERRASRAWSADGVGPPSRPRGVHSLGDEEGSVEGVHADAAGAGADDDAQVVDLGRRGGLEWTRPGTGPGPRAGRECDPAERGDALAGGGGVENLGDAQAVWRRVGGGGAGAVAAIARRRPRATARWVAPGASAMVTLERAARSNRRDPRGSRRARGAPSTRNRPRAPTQVGDPGVGRGTTRARRARARGNEASAAPRSAWAPRGPRHRSAPVVSAVRDATDRVSFDDVVVSFARRHNASRHARRVACARLRLAAASSAAAERPRGAPRPRFASSVRVSATPSSWTFAAPTRAAAATTTRGRGPSSRRWRPRRCSREPSRATPPRRRTTRRCSTRACASRPSPARRPPPRVDAGDAPLEARVRALDARPAPASPSACARACDPPRSPRSPSADSSATASSPPAPPSTSRPGPPPPPPPRSERRPVLRSSPTTRPADRRSRRGPAGRDVRSRHPRHARRPRRRRRPSPRRPPSRSVASSARFSRRGGRPRRSAKPSRGPSRTPTTQARSARGFPTGVLLHGPPGVGKTASVLAVAAEVGGGPCALRRGRVRTVRGETPRRDSAPRFAPRNATPRGARPRCCSSTRSTRCVPRAARPRGRTARVASRSYSP